MKILVYILSVLLIISALPLGGLFLSELHNAPAIILLILGIATFGDILVGAISIYKRNSSRKKILITLSISLLLTFLLYAYIIFEALGAMAAVRY